MSLTYTWWQDEEYYLGYLNDFPEYQTQGSDLNELQRNLIDLYKDIQSDEIPFVRHTAELVLT